MLSAATAVDITFDDSFDDDQWLAPPAAGKLYRVASVGNSWGVTSIGRGFDWSAEGEREDSDHERDFLQNSAQHEYILPRRNSGNLSKPNTVRPVPAASPVLSRPPMIPSTASFTAEPTSMSTISPRIPSASVLNPLTSRTSSVSCPTSPRVPNSPIPNGSYSRSSRSSTASRPRRRSTQQRVSLIAGRVSIAPMEPPSPPPGVPPALERADSGGSVIGSAPSTGPPTPAPEMESFLGGRSISEFHIDGELGRGAYGLVKRAREYQADGSLGPPVVIKQIIKSRILADCWKRHPKYGTIPIEIYVMFAISTTSYVLPAIRPWFPLRFRQQFSPNDARFALPGSASSPSLPEASIKGLWEEGKVVHGHPNICPLLDFFEDNHYYYLVLPSTTPEHQEGQPAPPTDLFDLVEMYPTGLPSATVRTYLGQLADAICFLHSHGIVHRDIKDENVVLGPNDQCILIDFGSSGLVKKDGWDTFSGTLDYAGPEILRGERYFGKEQDVWAFGVVAFVLLVGECPFMSAAEAQEGIESPFSNAAITLDERCGEGKEAEGEEPDGGGALGDAAALVRACLQLDVKARPTFEKILQCRFLSGHGGWGMEFPYGTDGPSSPVSPQPSAFPVRAG